jgi:hypothetical protein
VLTHILVCFRSAVPHKVEEAFRAFRYVPHTALTSSARLRAARGEEEFIINAQGGITAKGFDRRSEKIISTVNWFASAKAAEDRTRFHHGDIRAMALTGHHTIVMELARSHNWDIAMDYDIQQREAVALNPAHDLSGLDTAALTIIATRPPPLSAIPLRTLKRPVSSDFEVSPSKKKPQGLCFRCGLLGHLPADCRSDSTAAGKAPAALARGAKSIHALVAQDGRQFCFNFAKSSSCSFGATCTNFHGCSVCRSASHGAGSCKSVG